MIMKLLSMTEFVELSYGKYGHDVSLIKYIDTTVTYCNFLKQPLEIGMFTPAWDGDVLEDPKVNPLMIDGLGGKLDKLHSRYQKAREKVLFQGSIIGLELSRTTEDLLGTYCVSFLNIEGLTQIHSDLTLTDSAIKQLGL